jgi:zinc transporter ZupT
MHFRIPEPYILLYAFLLNLVWETAQSPLFVFDQQSSAFSIFGCLLFCSGVDALMTLTTYWAVSVAAGGHYWFLSKQPKHYLGFLLSALTLAFASEYSAVHYRNLWNYSELMPIIPVVNVGLAPFLQWLAVPPLTLILLNRHFTSMLSRA